MAHKEQADFIQRVKNQYPEFFEGKKVLDVGSLDINGTARHFFDDCDYTGIDVGEGPAVDIVCPGQDYDAPDKHYDVVLSAECFEHNPYWLETFQNMFRMCKDGGLIFFTCATHGREEHGTTRSMPHASPLTVNLQWDYYKNLDEENFTSRINFDEYFEDYKFETRTEYPQDLYFVGLKKPTVDSIKLKPKTNFSKYVYSSRFSNHWIDLLKMVEYNYAHELNPKDTLVIGHCVFEDINKIKKQFYGAERYIVYQLEPLHKNHWHSIEKLISNIKDADEVWDYDLDNIEVLKQYGINAKFKPFLYAENLRRVRNREEPDIDVLFYGTPTEARNEIFQQFYDKYMITENLHICFNCHGDQLDEYISRSKIILDLHTDVSYNVQKQTRIFYALINGKCVISEKSRRNYYGDLIVECDRDLIGLTTVEYLRSNLWKKQSSMVSEKFKMASPTIKDLFLK